MRMLIATGIFEPDIGGPATYASRLAQELKWPDGDVTLITFSDSPEGEERIFKVVRIVRTNRLLNRIKFFFGVFRKAKNTDLIYSLDWFAAGLPVAVAARLRGVPYIIRVGGDYLWERYMESGRTPVTLENFYRQDLHKKFLVSNGLIRYVLRSAAHVVFNTDKQRELYVKQYDLNPHQVSTIYNPVPTVIVNHLDPIPERKEFVFWGRFTNAKNLDSLIRAFAKANLPKYVLTLIGDGPCKAKLESLISELDLVGKVKLESRKIREEVWDRVKDSRALVLPSWTDISPNIVYEALALKLPALVTRENYLSIRDQLPLTVDPGSVDDIAAKLKILADDSQYVKFADAFRSIQFAQSWDDVTRQHKALFESILAAKV